MDDLQLVPLTALDRAFLFLDRRNQPFHVAYLNLYTPPRDAAPGFVHELAQKLGSTVAATPPFNRRLERRFGGDWWVEDNEAFDLEQHLVHLALPHPGRMKDLMCLISRLHAGHLDRSCPLWRMYLIEGLSDGRIATYYKMHHALADGVAGTRLMLKSMSADPRQQLPAPWAPPRSAKPPAHKARRKNASLASRCFETLGALRGALADARETAREVKAGYPEVVGGHQAPASILNQRISASREFAARSYSLTRVQALGQTFDGTTNDIALALCAGALRRFLIELDALPEQALVAMVPMSTRSDDSMDGNQVVPMLVSLGTDVADPIERLHVIRRSVGHSKARYLGLGPLEAYAYTVASSGPGLLKLLLRPSAGGLPFNLVISNIAGPKEQRYWQGCQLDAMYPLSVLVDGLALNITFASRGEWLDFGLIACRRSLPQVQRLLVCLEDALNELESVAALQAPCAPVRESRPRAEIASYKRRERSAIPPKTGSSGKTAAA